MLPRGPERGNDPLQEPSGGPRSHFYTAERMAWLIIFLKICLFLSKKEANKQRGACFWDVNKEDFFFLLSLFFSSNRILSVLVEDDAMCVREVGNLDLICMLTFLLSTNDCLTKSLAKHSEIDFQREFALDHLKGFAQQPVFGGRNRRWCECHIKRTWAAVVNACLCQRSQLLMPSTSRFGEMVSCGGRVKLGVCLILSSFSALGQVTFPVLTLESFTYKSDIMIPTTRDVNSFLNISQCIHIFHPDHHLSSLVQAAVIPYSGMHSSWYSHPLL